METLFQDLRSICVCPLFFTYKPSFSHVSTEHFA